MPQGRNLGSKLYKVPLSYSLGAPDDVTLYFPDDIGGLVSITGNRVMSLFTPYGSATASPTVYDGQGAFTWEYSYASGIYLIRVQPLIMIFGSGACTASVRCQINLQYPDARGQKIIFDQTATGLNITNQVATGAIFAPVELSELIPQGGKLLIILTITKTAGAGNAKLCFTSGTTASQVNLRSAPTVDAGLPYGQSSRTT